MIQGRGHSGPQRKPEARQDETRQGGYFSGEV